MSYTQTAFPSNPAEKAIFALGGRMIAKLGELIEENSEHVTLVGDLSHRAHLIMDGMLQALTPTTEKLRVQLREEATEDRTNGTGRPLFEALESEKEMINDLMSALFNDEKKEVDQIVTEYGGLDIPGHDHGEIEEWAKQQLQELADNQGINIAITNLDDDVMLLMQEMIARRKRRNGETPDA